MNNQNKEENVIRKSENFQLGDTITIKIKIQKIENIECDQQRSHYMKSIVEIFKQLVSEQKDADVCILNKKRPNREKRRKQKDVKDILGDSEASSYHENKICEPGHYNVNSTTMNDTSSYNSEKENAGKGSECRNDSFRSIRPGFNKRSTRVGVGELTYNEYRVEGDEVSLISKGCIKSALENSISKDIISDSNFNRISINEVSTDKTESTFKEKNFCIKNEIGMLERNIKNQAKDDYLDHDNKLEKVTKHNISQNNKSIDRFSPRNVDENCVRISDLGINFANDQPNSYKDDIIKDSLIQDCNTSNKIDTPESVCNPKADIQNNYENEYCEDSNSISSIQKENIELRDNNEVAFSKYENLLSLNKNIFVESEKLNKKLEERNFDEINLLTNLHIQNETYKIERSNLKPRTNRNFNLKKLGIEGDIKLSSLFNRKKDDLAGFKKHNISPTK